MASIPGPIADLFHKIIDAIDGGRGGQSHLHAEVDELAGRVAPPELTDAEKAALAQLQAKQARAESGTPVDAPPAEAGGSETAGFAGPEAGGI